MPWTGSNPPAPPKPPPEGPEKPYRNQFNEEADPDLKQTDQDTKTGSGDEQIAAQNNNPDVDEFIQGLQQNTDVDEHIKSLQNPDKSQDQDQER